MLGLLGILGAMVAGLAMDSGSSSREAEDDPEETPEHEAFGVSSTAFLGFDDEGEGSDSGGTEPDGQPVSDDTPDPADPDQTRSGSAGADQMISGSDHDRLEALAGDDYLDGGLGDDSLVAGAGQDLVHGGAGHDMLAGGDGDDSLWGDADNDLLTGGAGDDRLIGGMGHDSLAGEGGNDTLWGADPTGDDGAVDFLNGGAGDDRLHLGAGDCGHGGEGIDTFTLQDFGPGAALAQITDFNPAEDDLVVIYDSTLHPDPQLSLQETAGNKLLLLDGVPLASLTAGAGVDLSAIRLQAA
ncbi:MAG: calcium-binding protein [Alphaproteobacteria bacterium]|nr:calcium-binding protein [Alphaproteobacteria bacterium]